MKRRKHNQTENNLQDALYIVSLIDSRINDQTPLSLNTY